MPAFDLGHSVLHGLNPKQASFDTQLFNVMLQGGQEQVGGGTYANIRPGAAQPVPCEYQVLSSFSHVAA